MPKTVMSAKGQVVIPQKVRAQLGLKRGDRFEVEVEDGRLILKPLSRHPFLDLIRSGKFAHGPSLAKELLEERRKDREIEDRRMEYWDRQGKNDAR